MALRRTKRRRSLSDDGLNLFNLCLSNDPEEPEKEDKKELTAEDIEKEIDKELEYSLRRVEKEKKK